MDEILKESENKTVTYVKKARELYRKYIYPQPDDTVNMLILEEHPEIHDYLEEMEKNKKLIVDIRSFA